MSFGKRKDGRFYSKTKSSSISKSGSIQASGLPFYKTKKSESPASKLGLADKLIDYGWKKSNMDISQSTREQGNRYIVKAVNMEKQYNPKLKDWVIHTETIFNEYSEIQNIFSHAAYEVDRLIEWRNDNNPKTWKWLSPIILDSSGIIKVFDSHNSGWIGDGYKGRVAITLMSPKEFLDKSDPAGGLENNLSDYNKKTIDNLAKKMRNQTPIDTPYFIVDEDLRVFSHEGRHRALAAIKAGIEKMPVYVYAHHKYTNKEIEKITNIPTYAIKPKSVRP